MFKLNTIVRAVLMVIAYSSAAQALEQDAAGAGRGRGYQPKQEVSASSKAAPESVATPLISPPATVAIAMPKVAQLPSVVSPPTATQPIDTDSAINPLTGKSFSEERLTRLLSATKLVTDITRQQVQQAQLQNELAMSADKRQADSAKLRSDVINVIPKKELPVSARESLKPGEQLVGKPSEPVFQIPAPVAQSKVAPAQMASGTMRIGGETFNAASAYNDSQGRVYYVDAQAVTGNKSSGSLNMGPATGSMAFPPNSAMMPSGPLPMPPMLNR